MEFKPCLQAVSEINPYGEAAAGTASPTWDTPDNQDTTPRTAALAPPKSLQPHSLLLALHSTREDQNTEDNVEDQMETFAFGSLGTPAQGM